MNGNSRALCPRSGYLTLPSPSSLKLFVYLEKFFSANTDIDSESSRVGSGSGYSNLSNPQRDVAQLRRPRVGSAVRSYAKTLNMAKASRARPMWPLSLKEKFHRTPPHLHFLHFVFKPSSATRRHVSVLRGVG